jgi:hypothetical protein
MRGFVEMIRYADDFVICVQYKDEAETILKMLKGRLGKFGLELAEDKTRIVEFGRFAEDNSNKRGGGKPGTFNFLGFTHYCTKSRNGKFKVGRTTDRHKLVAKVKEMNQWLKSIRNTVRIKVWWGILISKMQGHYRYYGVSENTRGIKAFRYLVRRLVFKWVNRRSQKKSMNWEQFDVYCLRHGFPQPKIYVSLYTTSLAIEGIGV